MHIDYTAARVLADSVSPTGDRLVTVEAVFPRIILAEWNTHRALSRNSASSRARPLHRKSPDGPAGTLDDVLERPFIPARFPVNQPGMSAAEFYGPGDSAYEACRWKWLAARDAAVEYARSLVNENVHKQIANRLIEPWMYHTAVMSATLPQWLAVFELRIAPDAQPEINRSAETIRDAIHASEPVPVDYGEWHLPLVGPEFGDDLPELDPLGWALVSAARCGRVSYLTHTGVRDVNEDIRMAGRLAAPKHLSPFEHVATPTTYAGNQANYRGWAQLRWWVERYHHQLDMLTSGEIVADCAPAVEPVAP